MSLSAFGSELAAGLDELRELAESRMRGTCLIIRPVPGAEQQDPDGPPGAMVPTYEPDPVYAGKHYLRYPGIAHEQNPIFAGGTTVVSRIISRIPFGAVVRPGDVLFVIADVDNPQLVGTSFRVGSIDDQSQATAQRLILDDYQNLPGVEQPAFPILLGTWALGLDYFGGA